MSRGVKLRVGQRRYTAMTARLGEPIAAGLHPTRRVARGVGTIVLWLGNRHTGRVVIVGRGRP